jgi:uncharacterized lipoprotein YddW (UPF0748 family)
MSVERISCQIYRTKSEFVSQSSTPSIGLNKRQRQNFTMLRKITNAGRNYNMNDVTDTEQIIRKQTNIPCFVNLK